MPRPDWTITVLTIPGREAFLRRLLESLADADLPTHTRFTVVYNRAIRDALSQVEQRFRSWAPALDIDVFFNNRDPTISGGRNYQLNLVKTPLVCFVDDDVTLHGNIFGQLEHTLRTVPAGIVGVPSVVAATGAPFKPRDTTPSVETPELRYAPVQGMLAAGYTALFHEIGGFSPLRRFWGEWTELNLRMWRNGFPTGYAMSGGHLRHWEDAPESPTRSLEDRARHVLWGLVCTALEYDATALTSSTEAFWRLVEERYLAYSFGEALTPTEMLRALLGILPELTSAMPAITQQRDLAAKHRFQFMPFHPIEPKDVQRVLAYANRAIEPYRSEIWDGRSLARRVVAKLWRRVRRRDP